jgi:hypothetical protein
MPLPEPPNDARPAPAPYTQPTRLRLLGRSGQSGRLTPVVSDKRRTPSPESGSVAPGMRPHRRRRVGRVPESLIGQRLTARRSRLPLFAQTRPNPAIRKKDRRPCPLRPSTYALQAGASLCPAATNWKLTEFRIAAVSPCSDVSPRLWIATVLESFNSKRR